MHPVVPSLPPALSAETIRASHARAGAARWSVSLDTFGEALARSIRARFGEGSPSPDEVGRFVGGLHLEDLALACACIEGHGGAWDHFVLQYRPILYRTAESLRVPGDARELADSLYAELFGLVERDGARRSLLVYFHGRSSLAGWLRSVLARRAVDLARAGRRLEPLPEREEDLHAAPATSSSVSEPPDPERPRLMQLLRMALAAAIAALDDRARLRLGLYYGQGLKLAQIGRMLGESEATVSRKLERCRRDLRSSVERRLREVDGLHPDQVALCVEQAADDQAFDLREVLPRPDV